MKSEKVKSVYPNIEDILYVKRGKKYIPASDPWAISGLRSGHWHVWVREGSVTMREPVWPHRPDLEAAMWEAKEAMLEKIRETSKFRANTTKMRPLERRAYKAYCDVLNSKEKVPHDRHVLHLWGCSAQDLVDAAFSVINPNRPKT